MDSRTRKVKNFESSSGRAPFEDWFLQLRDKTVKARVATRIDRLRLGNFGDCKSLGAGVFELRIHVGPGFRVYFGAVGNELILLLGGGDKASQSRDIATAHRNWKEFNHAKKKIA